MGEANREGRRECPGGGASKSRVSGWALGSCEPPRTGCAVIPDLCGRGWGSPSVVFKETLTLMVKNRAGN